MRTARRKKVRDSLASDQPGWHGLINSRIDIRDSVIDDYYPKILRRLAKQSHKIFVPIDIEEQWLPGNLAVTVSFSLGETRFSQVFENHKQLLADDFFEFVNDALKASQILARFFILEAKGNELQIALGPADALISLQSEKLLPQSTTVERFRSIGSLSGDPHVNGVCWVGDNHFAVSTGYRYALIFSITDNAIHKCWHSSTITGPDSPPAGNVLLIHKHNTEWVLYSIKNSVERTVKAHIVRIVDDELFACSDKRRFWFESIHGERLWEESCDDVHDLMPLDENHLAVFHHYKGLSVWDIEKRSRLYDLPDCKNLAVAHDAGLLVTSDMDKARVFRLSDGQLWQTLDYGDLILEVTPDGRNIVTASIYGRRVVFIYGAEWSQCDEFLLSEGEMVSDAKFSPDGKTLIIAGRNVYCLDVVSRRERWRVSVADASDIDITADNERIIVIFSDLSWRCLRLATGDTMSEGFIGPSTDLIASLWKAESMPDGVEPGLAGEFRCWSLAPGKLILSSGKRSLILCRRKDYANHFVVTEGGTILGLYPKRQSGELGTQTTNSLLNDSLFLWTVADTSGREAPSYVRALDIHTLQEHAHFWQPEIATAGIAGIDVDPTGRFAIFLWQYEDPDFWDATIYDAESAEFIELNCDDLMNCHFEYFQFHLLPEASHVRGYEIYVEKNVDCPIDLDSRKVFCPKN